MTASTHLDQASVRRLVSDIFVYAMPFNQALGLKMTSLTDERAALSMVNQARLVGNAAQNILHGGIIASLLDVAAGLICVYSAMVRQYPVTERELRTRLSRMGTIDLRVDYLRPGRGEHFIASSSLLRAGNKISVARAELHNNDGIYIASATATYLVG